MSAVITEPPLTVYNPLSIIEKMVQSGTDPERLGKFLDLAERWERDQAVKAYAAAMNRCQQIMPVVIRDKVNGHTKSKYAPLEDVNNVIKPVYTKEGFSISFGEGTPAGEGSCRIIADVIHSGGHTRQYYADIPIDGAGIKGNANMTPTQGKGSTLSYGKRYLVCMIFNVTIADQDNDGNGPNLGGEEIKVINQIIEEIRQLEEARPPKKLFVLEAFVRWLKADAQSLDEVPMSQFSKAVYQLNLHRKLLSK